MIRLQAPGKNSSADCFLLPENSGTKIYFFAKLKKYGLLFSNFCFSAANASRTFIDPERLDGKQKIITFGALFREEIILFNHR